MPDRAGLFERVLRLPNWTNELWWNLYRYVERSQQLWGLRQSLQTWANLLRRSVHRVSNWANELWWSLCRYIERSQQLWELRQHMPNWSDMLKWQVRLSYRSNCL